MRNVVIIGGGHNGLTTACYLARAGFDVTVLERRRVVGGAAVTEEFHPGFRNSVASYTVSLLHEQVISDLNLAGHGLTIVERAISNYLPLPGGDSFVSYPDAARRSDEIARFSNADAEKIDEFYERLEQVVDVVRDWLLRTPPSLTSLSISELPRLFSLSRSFTRLSATARQDFIRLFSASAGEMLDDEFETDALKALIGFDAVVGNYASPYQAGSAYVMLHHLLGGVNGKPGTWGHAVGGMGSITECMAAEAAGLGVKIETGCSVDRVLITGNAVSGVSLDNGEQLKADIAVAGVNPKLLFLQLLDEHDVPADTLAHFRRYKCASGTFRMNVALSELPAFSARRVEGDMTAGIIMAPSLRYMDQAYHDATRHGFARAPIVEMLIPSVVDDSLAPPGQHVASLFCQQFNPDLGADWESQKEPAINAIFDTVNRYAPNFRASVLGYQAFSPYDLEQEFGLIGGDIFHGRLSVEQLFSARPMLGMGQYQTGIKGLWMCGSGTHPGGGVSGMPGHNAAQAIIRST